MWESQGVSVIGNLFAHNASRNPELHEFTTLHFINNVVYDWGKDTAWYGAATMFYVGPGGGQTGQGAWLATWVGNKYIVGPPPYPFPNDLYVLYTWSGLPGSALFYSDNSIDQRHHSVTEFGNNMGYDPRVANPPVPYPQGFQPLPSSAVEAFVLANAGARPADRDAVDTRIVNEVSNRTGGVISSQDQVGGWPTLAVNVRPLTLPANLHAVTSTGYTNLEIWLHGYATALESGAPQPQPLIAPSGVRLLSSE